MLAVQVKVNIYVDFGIVYAEHAHTRIHARNEQETCKLAYKT